MAYHDDYPRDLGPRIAYPVSQVSDTCRPPIRQGEIRRSLDHTRHIPFIHKALFSSISITNFPHICKKISSIFFMWYWYCALVRSPPPSERKYVNLRKYHEQLVKDIRSCTFPAKHPSFLFEKCKINGNRYETNRTSLVAFKKWKKQTNKQTNKKQANKQTIFVSLNMLYSATRGYSRSQQTETDQEKVDLSLHS